ADRYATPRQLAADVERWLADEPVAAYPEPWARRLRRGLARHRTLAASAVAALVVAALLGSFGALQARSHARAPARGEPATDQKFRRATAALSDIFDFLSKDELSDQPGLHPLRLKLREYYEDFAREHADEPGVQADLADIHARLGTIAFDTENE